MRQPRDQWRAMLLWVSVPVYLAALLRDWTALPHRLAIHFSASGAVNNTESRGAFVLSSLILLVGEVFILAMAAHRPGRDTRISRIGRYAVCYGFTGFLTSILIRLLHYNLRGGAIASVAVAVGLACAVLGACIALTIPEKPRAVAAVAANDAILGQATHRSILQSAILCSIVALLVAIWIAIPLLRARIICGCVLLVIGYFAMITAWGFRYLVSPTDLQIRWGFRHMEDVAASDIESVTVEPIHPVRDFGGWGARWSGRDRAYIWKGKTAVRIATAGGNIFLGADAPEDLLTLLRRMDIPRV